MSENGSPNRSSGAIGGKMRSKGKRRIEGEEYNGVLELDAVLVSHTWYGGSTFNIQSTFHTTLETGVPCPKRTPSCQDA